MLCMIYAQMVDRMFAFVLGTKGFFFVKRDIRLYRTQWAQPFALPEGAGSELQLRAIGSQLTGMCPVNINMVLVRGMTY